MARRETYMKRKRAGSVNWNARAQQAWAERDLEQLLVMSRALENGFECPECRNGTCIVINVERRWLVCPACGTMVDDRITIGGSHGET